MIGALYLLYLPIKHFVKQSQGHKSKGAAGAGFWMTVIYADPGKLLRMSGALGPMQEAGVTGTLTFELKAAGEGTQITLSYSAGGYFQGGLQALAAPVDQVLGAQMAGLVKLLGK